MSEYDLSPPSLKVPGRNDYRRSKNERVIYKVQSVADTWTQRYIQVFFR